MATSTTTRSSSSSRHETASSIDLSTRAACHDSFEEVVIVSLASDEPTDDDAATRELRQRLYDRALRCAQVDHHSLSPLFDSTSPERRDAYIAWRIEPGRSLRARLAEGPLDTLDAASTARSVGEGLAALHDAAEIHGRVSPATVWMTRGGRGVVLAPGLGDLERAPERFGSATCYRSPEQLAEARVGQAADSWAVGVLLFEMLTGDVPFVSDSFDALTTEMAQAPPPSVLVPGTLPEQLRPLVAECLSPQPDERPTLRELTSRLDSYLSELEPRRVARESTRTEQPVEIITSPRASDTQPTPAVDDWRATARWLSSERRKRAAEPEPRGLWIAPAILLAALLALALWWLLRP